MNSPRRYDVLASVEAWQWDGSADNANGIVKWILNNGGSARYCNAGDLSGIPCIALDTRSGTNEILPGYWAIRGVTGEFFECKPMEFQSTYREVITR